MFCSLQTRDSTLPSRERSFFYRQSSWRLLTYKRYYGQGFTRESRTTTVSITIVVPLIVIVTYSLFVVQEGRSPEPQSDPFVIKISSLNFDHFSQCLF